MSSWKTTTPGSGEEECGTQNARCKMIVVLLLVCLLLCGCAGLGDWAATLVEDYAIWRINGVTVVLVKEDADGNSGRTVVDSYIYRVTWNNQFICAQRTDPPESGEELPIVPEVDYYILRIRDGEVFGPYTAAEYKSQCEILGVSGLPNWVYVQDLRP